MVGGRVRGMGIWSGSMLPSSKIIIMLLYNYFLSASSLVSVFAKTGAGEGLGMRLRFLNERLLSEIAT